uniref:histidine kinase n=1 Tax=Magnetococcus massalia (strain MO-1) TaxID=451514 RepID=A0A1S7LJ41_MAGMO|nr:Putative histidine kinase. Containing GAF, HisKA HATPase_c, Response_reg domain [Candidatus Magnetococcus massalia]
MAEPSNHRRAITAPLKSAGIGKHLLVVILLFSSLVTLVLTTIQLYLDFRRDVTAIESRLDEVQQSHVQSIAASLWDVNEQLLRLQLEGVVRLPDLVGVVVREDVGMHSDPFSLAIGSHRAGQGTIQRDYILNYTEPGQPPRRIGQLHVTASLEEVYARMWEKAWVIFISQGVKTFLVSLFILFMIHQIITRHLITISRHVTSFDLKEPHQPLVLERKEHPNDELEMVVASVNAMSTGLEEAYSALQEKTLLLEQQVAKKLRAQQSQEILSRLLATGLEPLKLEAQLKKILDIILRVPWLHLKPQGAVFLMAEDGAALRRVAEHALESPALEKCVHVPLGFCLCGKVAQSQQPLLTSHLDSLHEHQPREMEGHGHCCVPINHQGTVLGVLNLYLQAGYTMPAEDQKLILSIADVLAGLIHAKGNEVALLEAKEAAEAGNRAKDRFLAVMSHELRTPMNAILGFAEVLQGSGLDEEQREILTLQQRASEELLDLITDILEMSQFDASVPEPEIETFTLTPLLTRLEERLAPRAAAKGIALRLHGGEGVGRLRGAPRLLDKVLQILLGNGIKFTAEGEVELRTQRQGESLLLEVYDTGVGISDTVMEHIFQPFIQADDSFTRMHGGAGVGLAVAHRYVTLMGGRIQAIRRAEVGSLFRVEIPHMVSPQESLSPQAVADVSEPVEDNQGLRIIYAEDDEMNAQLVAKLLSRSPHSLLVVENGAMAVERVKAEPFDLVLMDIQMPVMDGYQATQAIRAWEQETGRKRLPIYALTAHALQQDMTHSHQAGCDKHLTKPIARKQLLETINGVAPFRAQ